MSKGDLFSRQCGAFKVFIAAHTPDRVRLDASAPHHALTIEMLDDLLHVLKEARRASRHAQWKAGNTGAGNGLGLSEEERRAAAQTDPEWAKRMLTNPPQPVNSAPPSTLDKLEMEAARRPDLQAGKGAEPAQQAEGRAWPVYDDAPEAVQDDPNSELMTGQGKLG